MASVCRHTWHFYVCFGDGTQALVLVSKHFVKRAISSAPSYGFKDEKILNFIVYYVIFAFIICVFIICTFCPIQYFFSD